MRILFPAIGLFLVAAASPVLAGPHEDTLVGISRCAAITDDRNFLDCIYGAAQPMRARLGLPPASAAQLRLVPPGPVLGAPASPAIVAAAPAPPAKKPGWFGSLFGGDTPALRMTSYSFDKKGIFTVNLSDGEVYRQAGNDIAYAHWRGPAANYQVIVTQGAFGGDQMEVPGESGTYVVQRLR